MQLAPVFISDTLDVTALEELTTAGIHSLWFEREILYCNDPDLPITIIENGLNYTVQYTE